MSEVDTKQPTIPSSIVTKSDLVRLVHEIEQLDVDYTTDSVHDKVGSKSKWKPVLSSQLSDYLSLNPANLEKPSERQHVISDIRKLKKNAPIINMTFASTADKDSLQKIINWLRENIHPQAVVAIGLQPDLVGGVYIRTTNHVHDFSIRSKLANGRHLIKEEVEAISGSR